ncbi:NAD(P)-dependent oxidoreductase [Hydrogenibacillus schlegelii]|uniref:6-phosphogluconate dehydrogenase n=1 Tax=Hydrogenibacillus schlegelii TaxID=1484 RepID=A0A132N9E6_HYDSH|nr:NAD(P)-dependent oxidoreductase [Hydrogenibacillus schlegelii]KWX06724.1 6-phosphogluconate dehydrogenase [Hydrogenibacillus schlegelii]OAR04008.1 6-phosphogluconate dehydrogenase [Hydrogenibacillus schlegelii]
MTRSHAHAADPRRAVGWIGLGRMGLPMATHLVKAGIPVVAWNRSPKEAPEGTVRLAASPAEAASAGIVFTMLADDAATEAVLPAILEGLPEGGIHVAMSTLGVSFSRSLAERHAARGQRFVAAPVFGRPDAAQAAKLRIVVAGPPAAKEAVRPFLARLGEAIFDVGEEPHLAHAVKLGGNFLIAGMLEALSEAYVFVDKLGVSREAFYEVLTAFFRSPVYDNYGRILLERRFDPPGFQLRLGLKDVRLIARAADEALVPLPLAALLLDRYREAAANGLAEEDWTAILKRVEAAAGLVR